MAKTSPTIRTLTSTKKISTTEFLVILEKQLVLISENLKLEARKRRAILSANGGELQQLTKDSEQYNQELTQLDLLLREETENVSRMAGLALGTGLKSQISIVFSNQKAKKLKKALGAYETGLTSLKQAVHANQELLKQANGSIHGILYELQNAWKKHQKKEALGIYGHKTSRLTNTHPQPRTLGRLLNKNA